MKKRPFRRLIAAFLTMALFVTLLPNIPGAKAEAAPEDENVVEIKTFKDLHDAATLSRTKGSANTTYRLMNDIDITDADYKSIANADLKYISFGSEDPNRPFEGTFDGNGHTISGLRYEEILTDPVPDTGLFSYTKGATIKNLTIKNARIEADMRAGIVVGYAEDTILQNVTVEESELAVRAADNVLLIGTDLGVRGGGIAGEMKNSVAYDCEVNNCSLITNNTSAVQALAGKDLYQGGIVGVADNSVIEYCRVIGDDPWNPDAVAGIGDDSTTARNTYARIYYDVAVGAIGGNTLYVGGIAGDIKNGTQIIDSFSTAELNFYCATYVSVLGVNVGHIGGITGGIGTDDCKITRCHYAGQASSYQYNPIAVIPIIQHDINISGVSDYFRQTISHDQTIQGHVNGVFFMDSKNPDVDMDSLRNLTGSSISSNGQYGPWSDDLYGSRSAWESFGFDFTGTVDRETTGGGESNLAAQLGTHNNKWVMDRELGIPVHGNSVAATFDFPGAGNVQIDATSLVGQAVETDNPYNFAVQGTKASETKIKLTYTPTDNNYKLDGWWRIPDITEPSVSHEHSYFEKLYNNYAKLTVPVYGDEEKTEEVQNPVKPEGEVANSYIYEPENKANDVTNWADNDLFVARVKALVAFHDYTGALINKDDGTQNDSTDDDWYYYENQLPGPKPTNAPEPADGAGEYTLIGWTTNGGKTEKTDLQELVGINAAKLDELKAADDFYVEGDLITKPLQLYPIYTNYGSNLITEFEGYKYDTDGNENQNTERAKREGVGVTSGQYDAETGTVTLDVKPEEGQENFPDGYEFMGWYVYSDDENSDPTADYCVSRDEHAVLSGYDLSKAQVFVARFKYRVDYYEWCEYGNNGSPSKYADSSIYTSIWHTFGEAFQNIQGLNFYREKFSHWGEDSDHHSTEAFKGNIYAQKNVYSVNTNEGWSEHGYDLDILNDFPGAGKIIADVSGGTLYRAEFQVTTNPGYHFEGWTWESRKSGTGRIETDGTELQTGANMGATAGTNQYVFFGRYAADVNFHMPSSLNQADNKVTVTRRYKELDNATYGTSVAKGEDYTYKYYINSGKDTTTPLEHKSSDMPKDESMQLEGYIFLGWVNGNEIDQEEKAYIWDVTDDAGCNYLTSSPDKVAPYILTRANLENVYVTEIMDFYPVYAKYNYDFTTNLEQMGFTGTETIGAPKMPSENTSAVQPGENAYTKTITFTVDNDTPVLTAEPGGTKYQVTSVEWFNETTGESGEIAPNGDGSYSYTVIAGNKYLFVANYDPVPVIYHVRPDGSEDGPTEVVTRNINDSLGTGPNPEFDAATVVNAVFKGGTLQNPGGGNPFHVVDASSMPELVTSDYTVKEPLELWPVYQQIGINVKSNIDSELGTDAGNTRGVRVDNPNLQSATLWAKDYSEANEKTYGFVGWYTGFTGIDQDGKVNGTLLSTDATAVLTGDEVFAGGTYTAVYKEAMKVQYHNYKGEVIYTAYVTEERSFVKEQEVPDGSGGTTTVTVTEDAEAYTKIQEEDNIPAKEQFVEWQWVKAGSDPVRWDDFCNETITGSMDLYPVTNAITVQDTNKKVLNPYKEASTDAEGNLTEATGDVMVSIGQETGTDGKPTDSIVTVLLRSNYDQPYVDVILSEKAYNGTDTPTEDIKSDEKVSLYLAGDDTLDNVSLYDTERTAGSTHDDTVKEIHAHFDLYGELKLTKALADDITAENGEVFMFNVQLGYGTIQKIPVNAGDTVTIDNIPFGTTCKVNEDTGWSWRYEVTWDDTEFAESGFTPSSYTPDKAVTATNIKTNDKWMDSSAYVSNQFGKDENGKSTITQIIPGNTTGEETEKK